MYLSILSSNGNQRVDTRSRKSAEKEAKAASAECNVSRVCTELHTGRISCAAFHSVAVSDLTNESKLRNWEDRMHFNWLIHFIQIVAAAGVGAIANSIPEANCCAARTRLKRQSHVHWRHIVAAEQRHNCTSQYSRYRRNIHKWREW